MILVFLLPSCHITFSLSGFFQFISTKLCIILENFILNCTFLYKNFQRHKKCWQWERYKLKRWQGIKRNRRSRCGSSASGHFLHIPVNLGHIWCLTNQTYIFKFVLQLTIYPYYIYISLQTKIWIKIF